MRDNIFESAKFLNEIENEKDNAWIKENYFTGPLKYALCTESIIEESYGDQQLLEALLLEKGKEASKSIIRFINMKEGDKYTSLRKDLKEVIKMNDLDDEELRSKGKGFMHCCKRIIQVLLDLDIWIGSISLAPVTIKTAKAAKALAATAAAFGVATPAAGLVVVKLILSFVISSILNRLLRFAVNSIEYDRVEKDAKDIIIQLRKKAKECEDPENAKALNNQADRLEKKLKDNRK